MGLNFLPCVQYLLFKPRSVSIAVGALLVVRTRHDSNRDFGAWLLRISNYSRTDGSKCAKEPSTASSGRGTTHFCAPFGWCRQSRHGGPCGGRSSRPDFGTTSRTLKKPAISLHSRSLRELKSDSTEASNQAMERTPGSRMTSQKDDG